MQLEVNGIFYKTDTYGLQGEFPTPEQSDKLYEVGTDEFK